MNTEVAKAMFDEALRSSAGPQATARAASERFAELVANGRAAPPDTSVNLGTVAEQLIRSQNAELQGTVNDALAFVRQAPTMTMNELSAASINTSLELAGMQLDLEAKMGVVDACKSSVETLMKNQ